MGALTAASAATAAAAATAARTGASAAAAASRGAFCTAAAAATVLPCATAAAARAAVPVVRSSAAAAVVAPEVTVGPPRAAPPAAGSSPLSTDAATAVNFAAPPPFSRQQAPCSAPAAAAAATNAPGRCVATGAATPAPSAAAEAAAPPAPAPAAAALSLPSSVAVAPAAPASPRAAAPRAAATLSFCSPLTASSSFAPAAAETTGEGGGGARAEFLPLCSSRPFVQQTNVLPLAQQQLSAAPVSCFFSSSNRFFSSEVVQRAVRELPWGSRQDLLRERVAPVYVQEKPGATPRREYNVNLLDGIRVRPTVNPFVKLNKAKRYVLDNWPSRNWDDWNPYRCYVRGSRRRYNIPQDLFPYKDELGEWHPPRLSARYKADVKKQYFINGLPWVWEKDFYDGKLHFADRELLGPKRWYRRAFRRERVKEALRKMDDLVLDYRQEARERKKYNWFEKVVHDFAGEEMATQFIRKRREPKF